MCFNPPLFDLEGSPWQPDSDQCSNTDLQTSSLLFCGWLLPEISRSTVCPIQSSSWKATNGMQCFVPLSLTWILTGRRKCWSEPMGRSVVGGASWELSLKMISPINNFTFSVFNNKILVNRCINGYCTNSPLLYFFSSAKQELLCYKFQEQSHSGSERRFQMVWRRSFKSPVLSITYLDLTGDGLKELAILTLKGLHIMQVCNDHWKQTPLAYNAILRQCFGKV